MLRAGALLSLAVSLTALFAPWTAAAGGPPPPQGTFRPDTHKHSPEFSEPKPAKDVEKLPSSITLRVGEKVSYSNAGQCALMNSKLARMYVNEKHILTLVGLKEGSTKIMMFGTGDSGPPTAETFKNPREIPVTVVY